MTANDSLHPARPQHAVAAWLFACCLLVFLMVVVGGITRLTHSGLSIVEWQPIVGTLPPLTDDDWDILFEKYRKTPEYQQVNRGMGIDGFKRIFWWEYFHRLLGRLIGIAYLVPFLWFVARGTVRGPVAWKLLGIFLLGGLQGAMGWYMVKSGLVDNPRVSHFRLTAHLGLAILIFGAMLHVGIGLLTGPRPLAARLAGASPVRHAYAVVGLVFLMILSGGLVAGIRAGFAYNTFPLMNGHLVPPELFMLEPWHANFFYNMATVQFDHRALAWLLAALVPWLWWRCRQDGIPARARLAGHALLATLALQIGLGIATLLLVVPVPLAAAHQGGAVLVFGAAIWLARELPARDRS
jgi:cytochrome c oxidase assembly protein subunit 15